MIDCINTTSNKWQYSTCTVFKQVTITTNETLGEVIKNCTALEESQQRHTSSEDINRTTLSVLEIITTLLLNTGGNSNDNNDNSMPTIKPLNSTYYCQLSLHTWEGCAWLRKHSPVMFGSTKVSFRLRFDSASASVFTLYEGEWRDMWIRGHKWKKEAHGLVWKCRVYAEQLYPKVQQSLISESVSSQDSPVKLSCSCSPRACQMLIQLFTSAVAGKYSLKSV